MRGLGFDPARETEMEGMRGRRESRGECRRYEEGARQGEETRREERRGPKGREEREGWTGWIRRLAAIDFSRQTRGLFVPLLVLVLLPSNRSLHRSPHSLFPSSPSSPSRASGSRRLLRPYHSRSLAPSLPSCSLMPRRPSTLDPRSLFSLSLPFLSTYLHLDIFLQSFYVSFPFSFFLSFSLSIILFHLYLPPRLLKRFHSSLFLSHVRRFGIFFFTYIRFIFIFESFVIFIALA